jgi:hypothetical protein
MRGIAFQFHDVEQNEDEWYALRSGLLTSSKLGVVMANFGKAFGDPAKKYAVNIAIEQITGKPIENGYSNEHMERGHQQEPVARMLYEEETFCEVSNGGFFGSEFVGCSPDGLVYDCGVIEIKSVLAPTHFANVKRQGIDPAYKWQCIGNLMFTDREWLDFVSYCADFPAERQLFVQRIWAKDLSTEFDLIRARINEFKKLVDSTREAITESNYLNCGEAA